MTSDDRTSIPRWLWAIVAADLLFVLVNALPLLQGRSAPALLSLDLELSVVTWYSSAKLATVGLLALCCSRRDSVEGGLRRLVWPSLAALFFALAVDESASLHERLARFLMSSELGERLRIRLLDGDADKDAFAWPVLLAPVVVAVVFFLAHALYDRMRSNRQGLALGLAGVACYVGAVGLEGIAVYTSPAIELWGAAELARYQRFMLVEESLELAGTTLMLAALLCHLSLYRSGSRYPASRSIARTSALRRDTGPAI